MIKSDVHRNSGLCRCGRYRILLVLVLMTFAVILSSGCLNLGSTDIPETEPADLPADLNTAILDFSQDVSDLDRVISIDLYNLAEEFSDAETDTDRENIALNYYAKNPWMSNLVYYNAVSDEFIGVPVTIAEENRNFLPTPTEQMFQSSGGTIHYSAVFNPDKGYQELDTAAVHDGNGTYIGYFIILYDFYAILNQHPMMIHKEKSYADYILFVVDESDGKVVYASKPEATGVIISEKSPYYDDQALILPETDKSGAYKYTSRAFYTYNSGLTTEKITAWKNIPAYKRTYKVYLIQELNKLPLTTENVFAPATAETIDNVIDLFVFSSNFGKEAAIARVNAQHYSTPIYILDMEGKVLASPYKGQTGLNFLNNRGAYGYAYTKGMVNTVLHGGGFVYYAYPIEGTVTSNAAQFSNSYVLPLDDDCFVLGYFSADTDVLIVDQQKREDVVSVSREIIRRAIEEGVDSVAYEINTASRSDAGYFVPSIKSEINEISIMDFNGFVYASIKNPATVGEVVMDYVDVYGGSTTRKEIMLAKSYGGFMVDLTANKTRDGYVDLWLLSVEPIGEEKFVHTSVLIGTYEDLLTPYYEVR